MIAARDVRRGNAPLTDLPPLDEIDVFDEAGYLRLNPGILAAVAQGIVDTAWNHYLSHGKEEGRQPNDVDPAFYLTAYPEIAADLGRPPEAADAAPHYVTLGRARGYLPHAAAPRPAGGTATASPFGGFWTDRGDGLDVIQARLELGRLTRSEARALRNFARDGIMKMENVPAQDQIEDVRTAIDQMFCGTFPELLFGPPPPATGAEPWRAELTEQDVAALDPHMLSRPVRTMLLDPEICQILTVLFDAPPRLTHSRAFLRQNVPPDRDAAWFGHTRPVEFVAVTVALEVDQTGSAFAWRGTHRAPDLSWPGGYVALSDAMRTHAPWVAEALAHRAGRVAALIDGREALGLDTMPGSRFVRHAYTIHSVEAPAPPVQQRSLTGWYCPSYVQPCYKESGPARDHRQGGFLFSSGYYRDIDPRA